MERTQDMEREPLTIGIWGTSDVANLGDLIFPIVIRQEMRRRLPNASLRTFAPRGYLHPVTFGGVRPAEALGPWTEEGRDRLAAELDGVIVGGGDLIHGRDADYGVWYGLQPQEAQQLAPSRYFIEGLGPEREAHCPVIWTGLGVPFELVEPISDRVRAAASSRPYASVRDSQSLDRLRAAGVDGEVKVVPDPAFLLPRVFPAGLLRRRLSRLRARARFPEGPALVVQGSAGLIPRAAEIAEAIAQILESRPGTGVVIAETGPCHGDGGFADALQWRLPIRPHRLPPTIELTSMVAAIACSEGFVGSSLHGAITALAYGRPSALFAGEGYTKLQGFGEVTGRQSTVVRDPADLAEAFARAESLGAGGELLRLLQARLDEHFDRVIGLFLEAAQSRGRSRLGAGTSAAT